MPTVLGNFKAKNIESRRRQVENNRIEEICNISISRGAVVAQKKSRIVYIHFKKIYSFN